MFRFHEKSLEKWWQKANRKPLVIRGARQVGKSTLVRNLAENHELELYELNLERFPNLDRIFQTMEPGRIIPELESRIGAKIRPDKGLLFLDEIQAAPSAIPALRYFYEDIPELAIVSAGSLLEFTLANHNYSMPVGRIEYLFLGPMSFMEFLCQIDPFSYDFYLKWRWEDTIPEGMHQRLYGLWREYLLVGGMPEAVSVFSEEKDFLSVREVHDSILSTYRDDFGKYASGMVLARLQSLFEALPLHVAQKVVYSAISREDKAREVKTCLELFTKARIITRVFHTHGNGMPLGAEADQNLFKYLFLDVGLLNTMNGLDWSHLSGTSDYDLINKGILAEQAVGQELLVNPELRLQNRLFYWLREGRKGNAELDYLINYGPQVVPVKVKAGKGGSMKSLVQFVKEKNSDPAVRFDLNPPTDQPITHKGDPAVRFRLLSLPLYFAGKLSEILNDALTD